jgi:hypothetical protein
MMMSVHANVDSRWKLMVEGNNKQHGLHPLNDTVYYGSSERPAVVVYVQC